MSKYYEPIRITTERYLGMLEEVSRSEWTSTYHYIYQFLQNILLKIEIKLNDYQLNREIAYATRVMMELRLTTTSAERHFYQEHFWSIDGQDYREHVEQLDEE